MKYDQFYHLMFMELFYFSDYQFMVQAMIIRENKKIFVHDNIRPRPTIHCNVHCALEAWHTAAAAVQGAGLGSSSSTRTRLCTVE